MVRKTFPQPFSDTFNISNDGSIFAGDRYTCKSYLRPKLSRSALGFSDLYWDPNTGQIRARTCRILRLVTLVRCTNIPLLGAGNQPVSFSIQRRRNVFFNGHVSIAGVEVTSRHVRFCLFDGVTVTVPFSVSSALLADRPVLILNEFSCHRY